MLLIASLPTNPIHPDLPMRGIHFTLLLRRQTTSLTIMHHRDANISVKHKRMLAEGEARFMRAAAYYYLASYWHDVPIMENPIAHTEAFNMAPTRFEDVIRYGIRDLEYAAEWLPLADADGRVTRYSALGLLARYYVTLAAYARGGHCTQATMDYYEASGSHDLADILYDLAKEAAGEVILAQNRYGLMEEYEEIFRVQNNNCKECIVCFATSCKVSTPTEWVTATEAVLCSYTELLNGLSAYNSSYVSYDCLRMLINSGGRSRLRGNVLCPGEFYDYIGTHLVDGGWAAGYKGGQKAAGLETNRKVAFKKTGSGVVLKTRIISLLPGTPVSAHRCCALQKCTCCTWRLAWAPVMS